MRRTEKQNWTNSIVSAGKGEMRLFIGKTKKTRYVEAGKMRSTLHWKKMDSKMKK